MVLQPKAEGEKTEPQLGQPDQLAASVGQLLLDPDPSVLADADAAVEPDAAAHVASVAVHHSVAGTVWYSGEQIEKSEESFCNFIEI